MLIIPQFLELAFPMAFLLGLILAFGRLSGDSELVVMRASGISLRELVRPVALAAIFVFSLALYLSVSLRPWANTELGKTLFALAKQRLSSGLVAGVFNELGVLTVYAEKVEDGGSRLGNVLISDKRDEKQQRVFIAKYGQIFSNEMSRTLNLKLFDGSIHEGRGVDYNITSFDSNSVTLSEAELLNDESFRDGKKASEMSMQELRASIAELKSTQRSIDDGALTKKQEKQLAKQLVEFHRRFALPFSCLAVGFVGMVLGIQPSRGGKSWGLALNITFGILVITLYYFAMAFSTALGEEAILPAWLTMWLPNLLFSWLAYFLFQRAKNGWRLVKLCLKV
jgi:lipopolysaccharide export system permease protein